MKLTTPYNAIVTGKLLNYDQCHPFVVFDLLCTMRSLLVLLILFSACLLLTGLIKPAGSSPSPAVANAIEEFKVSAPIFARDCAALHAAITNLNPRDRRSVLKARQSLAKCRLSYKRIGSFMEYFFRSSSRIYNAEIGRAHV